MTNTEHTLTIKGRTFRVEKTERGWLLHGKRGAVYMTMRFTRRPERMFLSSTTRVDPLGEDVILTERDGRLCVCATMGRHVLVEEDGSPVIVEEMR